MFKNQLKTRYIRESFSGRVLTDRRKYAPPVAFKWSIKDRFPLFKTFSPFFIKVAKNA